MSSYNAFPEPNEANRAWFVLPADGTIPNFDEYPNRYPAQLLEGQAAVQALERYEAAGAHLQEPKIPEFESFVVDRELFDASYGYGTACGVVRDRLDPEAVDLRVAGVGKYATNNRRLAFVNGQGEMTMARFTQDNLRSLQLAGYMPGSVSVPFSNSENPDPDGLSALYFDLHAQMNMRDELTRGSLLHTMDMIDLDGSANPAVLATRGLTTLQSQRSSDYREVMAMDPGALDQIDQEIQALKDQITLKSMPDFEL